MSATEGTFVVVPVCILVLNVEKDFAKNVLQDYVILVVNWFVKTVLENVIRVENCSVKTV